MATQDTNTSPADAGQPYARHIDAVRTSRRHINAAPATPPISYESGGSDPDFYFPAAGASKRAPYRDRFSTLPGMLLRFIRR